MPNKINLIVDVRCHQLSRLYEKRYDEKTILHHDVFRKVLFDTPVNITNIGDSVVMNGSYSIDNEWVANQMYVAVMLQDESSKTVLQSAASELLSNPQSISGQQITVWNDLFMPNPAIHSIRINNNPESEIISVIIYDLNGREMISTTNSQTIYVSGLINGLYVAHVRTVDGKLLSSKILKRSY